MTEKGQRLTQTAYSNPDIVAGYVQEQALSPKMANTIKSFGESLSVGAKIVDIGCGPGQDAYEFQKKGFHVTGVDYSPTMISVARSLKNLDNPPQFIVGDMKSLDTLFPQDTFDAAWISSSLFHIPESQTNGVLQQVHTIVKKEGKVFIAIKGGVQGEEVVTDRKYGTVLEREFTFWERETFEQVVLTQGFEIEKVEEQITGTTGGKPTSWLRFFLRVNK